jgi:hypothetical protein
MLRRILKAATILFTALVMSPGTAAAQDDFLIVCWYQGRYNVDGVVQDGWYCMDNTGGEYWIAIRVAPT